MMGILEFILILAAIIVGGIVGLYWIACRYGMLEKIETDDKKKKKSEK